MSYVLGRMSYMSKAKVSYTLRIPEDLKRLMEESAAREGVTLTSLVVRACWQYLDRSNGVAMTPKVLRKAVDAMTAPIYDMPPDRPMCSYREYDTDTGETMAC